MEKFEQGLGLVASFYGRDVLPKLRGVPHAAGRIGEGSDVLGLDDVMSSDHDWGAQRLQIFVPDGVSIEVEGIRSMTPREFFRDYLAYDIDCSPTVAEWLTFSEQKLLSIVKGAIFHDEIGLREIRTRFTYYPHDIWLYQVASAWHRIGQEEHLVGRAGYVGDELGAKLIASRLVRDLMRLSFLYERRYAPYPKWFGTVFGTLNIAEELQPLLLSVLEASGWEERDARLSAAYRVVARKHNSWKITAPLPEEPGPFFGRPFHVIHLAGGFAEKITAQIEDPKVRAIAAKGLIGSVDMFSDSTDVVSHTCWSSEMRQLFRVS
ncbi:MAG: DUF4037 domain-containing protein [Fimbriimonas sp.]